jgi:hypothetical protein
MNFMSFMCDMPDRAIEEFTSNAHRVNRRTVGMKSSRTSSSVVDEQDATIAEGCGRHAEAWSPGRGYRGAWAVFNAKDAEKEANTAIISSAHEHMRSQAREKNVLRRAVSTPPTNPAYPSPNRMTPGSMAMQRSNLRGPTELPQVVDSARMTVSPISGLPMNVAKGRPGTAELRQLKKELQKAIKRCSHKLKDPQKRPDEVQALQQLSRQQHQALEGIEEELFAK